MYRVVAHENPPILKTFYRSILTWTNYIYIYIHEQRFMRIFFVYNLLIFYSLKDEFLPVLNEGEIM
jgi:hypothetical protein